MQDKVSVENNPTYLFFVGSGRTGSSFVGQILNCHPNVTVTNELRCIETCIKKDIPVSSVLSELIDLGVYELYHGTRQYDKQDKKEHAKKWQRDWKDITELSPPKKTTIKIVGDKKQGGNSRLLRQNPEGVKKVLDISWIPLTVIRDPIQTFLSYMKLNQENPSVSCDQFIDDMTTGLEFTSQIGGLVIQYETVLEETEAFCHFIQKALKLEHSEEWVELVKKITNSDKKKEEISEQNKKYIESREDYKRLKSILDALGVYND